MSEELTGYILFADQPDLYGRVFREQDLRDMADREAHLIYDEDRRGLRISIPSTWGDKIKEKDFGEVNGQG